MQRIVVANAKGGCGKTTLTTNICAYYSSKGLNVRLFDYDTQESSLEWLKLRNNLEQLKKKGFVDGVSAFKNYDHHFTRSWMLRVPENTHRVVIDTPAGTSVSDLASLLNEGDRLIIPVMASPIDISAAQKFVTSLLQQKTIQSKQIDIAIVANRVKEKTKSFFALEQFLFSLKIPFLAALRDTQLYSRAYEMGIGVSDLKINRVEKDKQQWAPIFRWCEKNSKVNDVVRLPRTVNSVSW